MITRLGIGRGEVTCQLIQPGADLSTLLHLQNIADEGAVAAAATEFKAQAASLKADQEAISKIVKDVKLAAKIVGAIGKALTVIAKF